MVTEEHLSKMESKWNEYKTQLEKAVNDSDQKKFEELLEERKLYIESIENQEEKKGALEFFLLSDKEIAEEIHRKKEDFKNLLLSQTSQLKAVNKYEQF